MCWTFFLRIINSKNSVNWTCTTCQKLAPDLNSIKSALVELKREVEQLKSLKTELSNNSPFQFEEIVSEVMLRTDKMNNIVIFNVNEQTGNITKEERVSVEKSNIVKMVTTIDPSLSNNIIKFHRIGKFTNGATRPRPIKVTLSDRSAVNNLVKNAKKLKDTQQYSNVTVSYDRTPRQISHYRELKKTLTNRLNNGETGLKIKYIQGIPKIVQDLN